MNRKTFVCTFACGIFIFLGVSLFAQGDDITLRYLNAANEQYSSNNLPKAYAYINIVLNSYAQESMPLNVEVLGETIYYSYLEELKNTRNYKVFNDVKEKLIAFPTLSSERVSRVVKIINTYEAQDSSWGVDPTAPVSSAGASSAEIELALEKIREDSALRTQETQSEFQKELLSTQKNAYESALRNATEVTGTNNRIIVLALIILAAISFIVFLIVIINLFVNLKTSKSQNDKFVETLKVVSQIAGGVQQRSLGLTALPGLFEAEGSMRLIGSESAGTGLPPEPEGEQQKAAFNELGIKCRDIGLKIDQATGRKNNSKNVAETVFKIAQEMGYGQYESTLLFMVGMVYDIGFLEIDQSLLLAENLNEDQKHEIRNHVKQGLAQLSFVPESYMNVFADGVLMHHENIDGSGYPEGLSGDSIPYIARVLRVAESFIALISKRSYRNIYDKESAVEELRIKPGLYDVSIIEALEKLI